MVWEKETFLNKLCWYFLLMIKKKILLFVPPDSQKIVMERDKEVNDNFGTYAPLGLIYIATYLREKIQNYVDVHVIDCTIGKWNCKKFKKMIKDINPDVVGVTVFTPQIMDVKIALKTIKEELPNCITVVGGPHVTSFDKHSLALNDIDFGVMGYGEYSFYKLIQALYFKGKLKDVPGLIYRSGNSIKINPIENKKINLDELPIPDRRFIPYKKYRCPVGTQEVMATLVSSRGCPFKCTFCNSPDKIYNARSMENVIEEVKEMVNLGIKEIFFYDDLFNLTNERVFEFCRLLKENRIKITWAFKSRVTNINEELIKTVKKCGCERIHFGIETHTDESLKRLKKGISVEQIKNAIKLCHKYKINSAGSFMINLPGDTEKDILNRFKFANSLKLDYVQYAVLVAYNHSEIFDDGAEKGLWNKNLWKDYIKNPTFDFVAPIWENGIDRKRLDQLVRLGLRRFYFRPSYVYQRIRSIHSFDEIKKYLKGALNIIKLNT